MLPSLAIALCALLVPAEAQTPELGAPWVEQFEADLDLRTELISSGDTDAPELQPLGGYVRYYRLDQTNGIVHAVFVGGETEDSLSVIRKNGSDSPRVRIGAPFPVMYDGGCSMITLTIRYDSSEVTGAYCNGLA